MTFNLKTVLLAGTALVAVGFAAPHAAFAADELSVDTDASGVFDADELATSAFDWATNTNGTGAAAEATNAKDVRVNATATINGIQDGNTIGDATTTTAAITSNAAALTLTIDDSVNDDAAETVTITGDISRGSQTLLNLTVTGENTDATADVLNLDINGAIDLGTGTFTIDTDTNAGNAVNVNLSGNLTASALVLKDDGAAITLTFDGTSAQTVSATINGETDADGTVVVANAEGVTFTGAIGGTLATNLITVSKTGANSAATFKAGVNSTAIVLGDGAGTGTNTVTFDGTTAGFTVAGTVNGTAGDTDNVVVSGGRTIVQSGVWGGVTTLNGLTVSGSGTILDSNAAITSAATTIGSGATLDVGAGLLTSAVANSGTLLLSGTGGVTGNITGTGTLDVNENVSVTGNVAQGAATVAEGKTLTVVGAAARTVTTDILLEDATSNGTDAGLTFDNGANTTTYTGNITTGVDGEGLITFADDAGATLALVGNVGTSSVAVGTLAVAGAGAQTLTTTGNLYVDAITVNDADTIQFLGTSAQTVSGTITDGILTVGNGTTTSDVTFSGALASLASATVSANAAARFDANATTTGAFTNGGSAYIGQGTTLTAASYAGAGTYQIEVADAGTLGTLEVGDFGRLASAGAINLAAETVNFNVTGNVETGTIASVFTGGAAAVAALAETDNSYRYAFDLQANGNNFDVVVTQITAAELGLTTSNDNVATILDSIDTTTNTELSAIIDNVAAAPTQAAANEVLEAVLPSVDAGAVSAGFNTSVQSLDVTNTRLAALRDGTTAQTGMVAGEMGNGVMAWAQAFGKSGTQDRRDGVDGYDADTYGLAVGVDYENALPNTAVGLAFSYANTDAESENANTTDTDVDSYQISLYGDFDVTKQTYVTGTLAYANNNIDQVRHDVGGVSGLNASADYDSNQYIVYAEAGHKMDIANKTTLTPSVLAHYQHISVDSYTETGAGGANLNVAGDDLNVFELGLGAELAWDLEADGGEKVRPALNIGYRHDLVGDNVETTSTFTGGGASFQTQGVDPAQGTFNVGASLGVALQNNWELSADYDYEVKEDYDAHSGYVRAGYKF